MKRLNKTTFLEEEETGETGEKKGSGLKSGSGGAALFLAEANLNPFAEREQFEESQLARQLSEEFLDSSRTSAKAKGLQIEAIERLQQAQAALETVLPSADGPSEQPGESGSGLDFDSHPELHDQGGELDPNQLIIPNSKNLSKEALRQELKNKQEQRLRLQQKHKNQHKHKIAAPRQAPKVESPRFRAQQIARLRPGMH